MKYIGHGGKEIAERILSSSEAKQWMQGLKRVSVTDRVARECIDLAYGFFTPLDGFMGKGDVDSVCEKMTLTNGTLWPIPIVFDIAEEEIKEKKIKEGNNIILTYYDRALAILEIEEIFKYDKKKMEQSVLGTTDVKHPGVRMINEWQDTFISGKITLICS